jgi:FAD/FMN-containing dehydrogenase
MTDLSHSRAAVDFTGTTLRPSDIGYDEARQVFNGMVDHHPELIMRCERTSDVVAALAVARTEGLPVSVYGGGHSVTGSAVAASGRSNELTIAAIHATATTVGRVAKIASTDRFLVVIAGPQSAV